MEIRYIEANDRSFEKEVRASPYCTSIGVGYNTYAAKDIRDSDLQTVYEAYPMAVITDKKNNRALKGIFSK